MLKNRVTHPALPGRGLGFARLDPKRDLPLVVERTFAYDAKVPQERFDGHVGLGRKLGHGKRPRCFQFSNH